MERGDKPPVPGGQSGGVTELAGARGDKAGRADAHAVQPYRTGLLGRAFQQRRRPFDGGLRGRVAADGQDGLGEGRTEQIRDDDGDAVRPYVEGREMGQIGDDPVQPRVGAAAPVAGLSDDPDQPRVLEPFHQVGDGGTGESGQRLELSCRQRAFLLEQSQGEPVVDGPCGARGCGHAGILPDRGDPKFSIYQAGFLIVYCGTTHGCVRGASEDGTSQERAGQDVG